MTGEPILPRSYSPATVQREYARVAWFYDLWGRWTEDRALQRLLQLADVHDGMRLLEVAVGTGRLFARLVARNPTGRNEGIDLSADMLARARRRLARRAPPASYRLQEASAYALPFEAATFDILVNTFMLDLLPAEDYPRLLAEFARVLKPGGTLALAYFSYGTRRVHRFWYWLARHFPTLLTSCRPIRLESYLEQAGFRVLHQEEISQNTFPSAVLTAQRGV